ncbi:MAG: IgA Peptidase M64 [Clostridium sp.]|nr:IgA Peptidase M64 [Clostridium sp.]
MMMLRLLRSVLPTVLLLTAATAVAAGFETEFRDSTLSLECTVGANRGVAFVAVNRAFVSDRWGGRRVNLRDLPLRGNARLTVTDRYNPSDTLYRASFSTLFNEWFVIPESKEESGAFEFTASLPLPRRAATVSVTFFDDRRQPLTDLAWTFNPDDPLIENLCGRAPLPFVALHRADTAEQSPVNIAILAEGYRADQMDLFLADAREATDALFSHEPFSLLAPRFNVVAVMTPSDSAGVSNPAERRWIPTAFRSHFDTFYSDRYLTTPRLHDLHRALAGIPAEHIIILANTETYGGGGIYNNYTLTAARHDLFRPVVVHEFGHSFGGLADEYFYEGDVMEDTCPTDIEPWEPNVTTLVNFSGKWENLTDPATGQPPLVEGGAYSSRGVWRAAEDCRMKTNTAPEFCVACRQALQRMIGIMTREKR